MIRSQIHRNCKFDVGYEDLQCMIISVGEFLLQKLHYLLQSLYAALLSHFSSCSHFSLFFIWNNNIKHAILNLQMKLSCFQIKSRFFSYFLGLRKRPGAVFGIFLTLVTFAITLTIFISTVIYWKSVKKTRVQPQGKIRKIMRRPLTWRTTALPEKAQQLLFFLAVCWEFAIVHFQRIM